MLENNSPRKEIYVLSLHWCVSVKTAAARATLNCAILLELSFITAYDESILKGEVLRYHTSGLLPIFFLVVACHLKTKKARITPIQEIYWDPLGVSHNCVTALCATWSNVPAETDGDEEWELFLSAFKLLYGSHCQLEILKFIKENTENGKHVRTIRRTSY